MGKRAGMDAALVLTGATSRADLARSKVRPDYVLEGLDGLLGR
jgi:ribonucleotide monophosphatase NagD (HAD superfamily)